MNNELDIIYSDKEHEPFGDIIQTVLDKLPYQVSRQICKHCVILIMGENYGQYHSKIRKYVILLNPQLMNIDKLSPLEKQYVVAHELAHFHKKHDIDNIDDKNEEIEAEELAQRWGFPAI